MATDTKTVPDQAFAIAVAAAGKGKLPAETTTAMGALINTDKDFGAQIASITQESYPQILWNKAIKGNDRLFNNIIKPLATDGIKPLATDGAELAAKLTKGTASLTKEQTKAVDGFVLKLDEASKDPVIKQIVAEAGEMANKAKNTALHAAQAAGISSLISGSTNVTTHSGPTSTTIAATVNVDTPAHK